MQASSSKSCNACRLHCPDRGVAAFGVARRFGLLLLSAAALPILWECTVISVYRQSLQCGERSNAAFRRQSAAKQTSLAPHDSKARSQNGDVSQGFMAKPCTPYPIPQAEQRFKPETANQTLSLGGQRGIFSFRGKRISPLIASLHGAGINVQRLRRCLPRGTSAAKRFAPVRNR